MTSKFWIGGTGTWDNTGDTHWSLSTGGANNTTHPVAGDTATLDGASGGGTVTVAANLSLNSIACGAFTGTLDFSANNNNVTLSAVAGFSGSGTGTRTINLGNGTFNLSATATANSFNMSTTTGLTFNANSSVIDFSGAFGAGVNQTFAGGGLTYSTVKISGARFNGSMNLTNSGGTIGTLNVAAAATVVVPNSMTITTLTQTAQLALVTTGGATLTVTNATALSGTAAIPLGVFNSSNANGASTATISCASGTFSGTYCAISGVTFSGGATFSFTSSFDLGRNTGATITAPAVGGATSLSRVFTGM